MTDSIRNDIRLLFPVVNRLVYFNNAGTGPLPLTAVRAIEKFCHRAAEYGEVPYQQAEKVAEKTRHLAGRLLQVKDKEVAFVKNTSSGLIIAINSIPWEQDDNLVMMKDAFPANTYPYHLLLPDIEKRFVTSAELVDGPHCIFRLVDEKTRAVALDWVHFLSGARFDIKAVAQFCQERKIFFIVDAIQGAGAVAEDFGALGADFVVVGGGKWLLAPQGVGLLYVNSHTFSRLRSANLGWLSCKWEAFNDCFSPKPIKKDARRYEEGTKNYIGIYGLEASLRLLLEFGIENIHIRINRLIELLRSGLEMLGFEILTPVDPERRAGIISCRKEGVDMVKLNERLREAGIVCAVRENWLRISPHFYNTETEVEQFLNQIKIIGAKF